MLLREESTNLDNRGGVLFEVDPDKEQEHQAAAMGHGRPGAVQIDHEDILPGRIGCHNRFRRDQVAGGKEFEVLQRGVIQGAGAMDQGREGVRETVDPDHRCGEQNRSGGAEV